jgi:hypothetical protein
MAKPTWRTAEVNLVKGALKARQAEDKARADAWLRDREAELEAVVGRSYNGLDVPGIPELMQELYTAAAPYIAEFDRLFTKYYPAEFAKAKLGVQITPGGFPSEVRQQVRRDANLHLVARHKHMVAKVLGHATGVVADASKRATDNPEVQDVLAKLAVPNETTPPLQSPGPAIGMLKRLLPHPEDWGFEGASASLLPAPVPNEAKALPAPRKKR